MKTSGFAVKASLIASLLITGQALAQTLPDEINHTQYLRIYQNLEQILNQKISEHEKLASQKAQIEKTIAQMERDQVELPARNSELRGLIAYKRQEVARLSSEIMGVEQLLDRVLEDIRHTERVLNSVQNDINQETSRNQMIQSRRHQQGQQVARVNARLQKEIKEENRSVKAIENLADTVKKAQQNKQQAENARAQLEKDIVKFRAEVTSAKSTVTQNTSALAAKRPLLKDVQAKLPAVKNEIAGLQSQISGEQTSLNQKKAELAKLKAEVAQGADHTARISTLESEINSLNSSINGKAARIVKLKQNEALITSQISALATDIKNLEAQIARLNKRIVELDKAIASYPENKRKLEEQIKRNQDEITQKNAEIEREQRLLARIRRDRKEIEVDLRRAQDVMEAITQDLITSDRILITMKNKYNEESQRREGLVRYQQENRRIHDSLMSQKASAEREIVDSSEEIDVNEQDMATIARELPMLRNDLDSVTPKVSFALNARNIAQKNADNANSQYQARLGLYQRYLTEAHKMGSDKASIGTNDGSKAGNIDAVARGTKLATENASIEAKWEALRRGYVRGEIAGFRAGYDVGYASTADEARGDADGRVAGAKRAKNHADLVVKPEFYLEELERRLKEDDTSAKPKLAMLINDEIKSIKSMARALEESIPDLSQAELAEAAQIVSSLDQLIAQSSIEIEEILSLRRKLSDARNVYATPSAGINANNVNCSAVYKGVKDYIEACKGSYVIRYQNLYNAAHLDAFNRRYGAVFNDQISNVYASELGRLYPGYLNEATKVGKEVGLATGKKDIYQETFTRSEGISYSVTLPSEVARVKGESVNLVQDHLDSNAALALKEAVKLASSSPYGISPGTEMDLTMMVKNIGSKASLGNSMVKLTSISGNVSAERREAPLTAVAPHTHANLNVLKLRVSDKAEPGTKVVIAGEIVHPGNHYRSSRIEQFRVEQELQINPSIDMDVKFETTPRVAVRIIGMIKTHAIEVKLKPMYSGVDQGYEVSLEEVGSEYAQITTKPSTTDVLKQGEEKKVFMNYKLSKSARGKIVNFKLFIKNGGKVISSQDIQVKAI